MAEKKLTKRQLAAIRQLAIDMANASLAIDEDTVLVCNAISEPPSIPLDELL
jgi:hypothetical protein